MLRNRGSCRIDPSQMGNVELASKQTVTTCQWTLVSVVLSVSGQIQLYLHVLSVYGQRAR